MTRIGSTPVAIRRRTEALEVDWGEGHLSRFESRALRLACPCAACVDEMTSRPLLDPASVPADVHPAVVELVGSYAIRVRWSDGHSTGIYTYAALLRDCPCAACAG